MFIERLEIYGFKSFAQKTDVILGSGLCTVMGPNGCGKSNILEAIRWAVGEQKLSLLRSNLLEDVIFKGSAGLKPTNYAEVSVEIAEARGLLPHDPNADRIRITRKAFRDGESEFFINGIKVRLKDIRSILSQVGLGDVGYAVIEQAMIERILGGTTEDRRSLFEQAAGIAKYKADKAATEQKLRATQEDLTRLEDILREVEAQEATLKRQVNKVKRYKKLLEKKRELELELIAGRLADINDKETFLAEEQKLFENSLLEIATALSEVRAKLQSENAKSDELETRRNKLTEEIRVLTGEIADRERRSAVFKERITSCEKTRSDASAQMENLDGAVQKASADIQRISAAVAVNERNRDAIKEQIKLLETELAQIDKQFIDQRGKKTAIQGILDNIRSSRADLENKIGFGEAEIKKIAERVQKLISDKSLAEKRVEEFEAKIIENRTTKEHLREKLERYETRREELRAELTETRKQMEKLDAGLSEKRQEKSSLSGRAHELSGIISRGEDVGKGVADLVKKAQQFGFVGILADMIDLPEEHLTLVERFLGARANFIIAEKLADALAAAETLPNNVGEVGFIVLDELEPSESILPLGITVKDARLRTFFAGIDVFSPESADAGKTYVSADGKFLRRRGELIVTMGKPKPGAIALRNQLKKLLAQIDELQIDISERESARAKIFDHLRQTESSVNEVEGTIKSETQKLVTAQNESAWLDAQKNTAERAVRESIANVDDLNEQIEKRKASIVEWQAKLAEVKERFFENSTAMESIDAAMEELTKQRRVIDSDLAARQISAVSVDGEIRNANNELTRLRATVTDATRRHEQAARSLADATTTLENARREIDTLHAEIQEKYERHSLLEQNEREIHSAVDEAKTAASQFKRAETELLHNRDEKTAALADIRSRIAALRASYEQIVQLARQDLDAIPEPSRFADETRENAVAEGIKSVRTSIDSHGPVNMEAEEQHAEVQARLEFLIGQKQDIVESVLDLRQTIARLDGEARRLFCETFARAQEKFCEVFKELFIDGEAELNMENPDSPLDTDIAISVRPAGKRALSLTQLSAGEKALTSLALLFGLYLVKPSPFCLMDEVDAPLDDANVERFLHLVRKFAEDIQFIVVSHNKRTLEKADYLYGVSMENDGVSRVVSIKMSDLRLDLR